MRRHLVILALSGILVAVSGYGMLMYGWAATAPASPELHARARLLCNIWTGAFLLGLVATVASGVQFGRNFKIGK
jgi:hypothetical protein